MTEHLVQRLIDEWQGEFPLCQHPFQKVADQLNTTEEAVLATIRALLDDGTLTRFGPLYQIERLGGAFSLAALQVPTDDFERITQIVNAFPEVAHNYQRAHTLNMWFVLATETPAAIDQTIARMTAAIGLPVFNFPKEREYFIEAKFTFSAKKVPSSPTNKRLALQKTITPEQCQQWRPLILATQSGLPVVSQPYSALAEKLGLTSAAIIQQLQAMLDNGAIRRVGVVPNHYKMGYKANGMTVWDVDDQHIDAIGDRIGALDFVTHCYRRPRRLPEWPYNLFAMAHGAHRDEVSTKAEHIAALLGRHCRSHDILYSTRILKKTGLRLSA